MVKKKILNTRYKVNNRIYDYEKIRDMAKEILAQSVEDLKEATINWINDYVPKRTGNLQEDLIMKVNEWYFDGNTAWIGIGTTNVEYADDIKGDVRHYGTWLEHDGSPAYAYFDGIIDKIFLNDPKARITFKVDLIEFIKDNWRTIIEKNTMGWFK